MGDKQQPIAMFKADPRNPRDITEEKLAGLGISMEELGDLSGIVFNKRSGCLVTAHQRMSRLRAAGAKEWTQTSENEGFILHPKTGERFKIRIVDWDEARARMAMIAANNPETQGDFTDDLETHLRELASQDLFDGLRLAQLMEDEPAPRERRALEDFESAPPPKRAWILIATDEALAAEIEADIRSRYEGASTRIEVSVGAR